MIDFLVDSLSPDAIVLFGSAARGEDIEDSDIDLLVIAKETGIDLGRFEERIQRRISIHFEPKISEIPKELLNMLCCINHNFQ